jgi:hypothetical protein
MPRLYINLNIITPLTCIIQIRLIIKLRKCKEKEISIIEQNILFYLKKNFNFFNISILNINPHTPRTEKKG